MIRRSSYLQRLLELKDQNLIKVVTGVRRSGKSTIMEAFKNELIESGVAKQNITFLNFEERENLHLTEWSVLYNEIYKYPILHEFLIKILAYTLIFSYLCIRGIIT